MDATAWDQRYAEAALVWSAEPNRFVAAELVDLPAGRALDLAAGEGRNAIWLAARGWRVTAVDFSAVAVDKGRRLAAAAGVEVDWVVADVLRYDPPEGQFDLVLVAYLHLPAADLATVLDAGRRALAPGGVLFVVGHDVTNLTDGVGGPQDASVLYSPAELAAHLAPLRIERCERVRRPAATETGDTRDAVDTLARAIRPAS